MVISKLLTKFVWGILRISEARIRCPVYEIGKNSVIPSITPRVTA
jgi:hypothetical protein